MLALFLTKRPSDQRSTCTSQIDEQANRSARKAERPTLSEWYKLAVCLFSLTSKTFSGLKILHVLHFWQKRFIRTDRPTDISSYQNARTHLKVLQPDPVKNRGTDLSSSRVENFSRKSLFINGACYINLIPLKRVLCIFGWENEKQKAIKLPKELCGRRSPAHLDVR